MSYNEGFEVDLPSIAKEHIHFKQIFYTNENLMHFSLIFIRNRRKIFRKFGKICSIFEVFPQKFKATRENS